MLRELAAGRRGHAVRGAVSTFARETRRSATLLRAACSLHGPDSAQDTLIPFVASLIFFGGDLVFLGGDLVFLGGDVVFFEDNRDLVLFRVRFEPNSLSTSSLLILLLLSSISFPPFNDSLLLCAFLLPHR